jgi:hypothetical protein
MYQKVDPSTSFRTFHLMSLTTYWCWKSHWIASIEPKAKLLQVVPNKLLDPIADQISLLVVSMNNCALLDYTPPPAPDCVTQVTPNRQLDQAILDQDLWEVEQLLQAQGGKTLEDFELPTPPQLATPGDAVVSEERARYNVTRQAQ